MSVRVGSYFAPFATASLAEFARALIRKRQREGTALALQRGVYRSDSVVFW